MDDAHNFHTNHTDEMAATLGLGRAPVSRLRAWRWWIMGGAAVVIIGLGAMYQFGGPRGPAYRTTPITLGAVTAAVTATGTLQPVNTVDLGPEISGQIRKVYVDYNDHVTAGQVLALIDTDTLNAKVVQSRASLTAAKAHVEDAKATAQESVAKLARSRALFTQGNASKQQLDTDEASDARARAAVGSAIAQVDVAAATLASDETTLAKAEIKSPINGIVLSRLVDPGQVVAATFQTPVLFKLAEDLSKMQLEVNVDEADIGHVREGQPATFTVDAFQDRQFPATITQVRFAPKTVDNVVTYQAVLTVDNGELLLRPGMTATAAITTATRSDATLVPNAALRFQPKPVAKRRGFSFGPPADFGQAPVVQALKAGSVQHVWTLESGAAKSQELKVGVSDGQFTEVVGGALKPGDAVIVGTETPPAAP